MSAIFRMGTIIKTAIVALLCASIQASSASTPCCKGENVLKERRCADGSKISALSCDMKYFIESTIDKNITVDENDNLIFSLRAVTPDKYCATTKVNGSYKSTAYLVCFEEGDVDTMEEKIFIIHAALELISVFFILITIIIYLQVPDLLDLQGIATLHSISGLAVSFFALGINQLNTTRLEETMCLTLSYVIYYSMLYAFFWLNILSFHIWRIIIKPKCFNPIKHWAKIYHIIGIGGPTVLLLLLIFAHHSSVLQSTALHPGLGEIRCWFKSMKSQFVYFYCPMAILLGLNIIYYSWTIAVLWKELTNTADRNVKALKFKLALCLKLFIIMGITWIFEILSAALEDIHFVLTICWIITDCLNTIQGILIFVVLVVCRKRVIRGLANRSFCGTRFPSRWRTLVDDECEDIEEEFGLSETQIQKS